MHSVAFACSCSVTDADALLQHAAVGFVVTRSHLLGAAHVLRVLCSLYSYIPVLLRHILTSLFLAAQRTDNTSAVLKW